MALLKHHLQIHRHSMLTISFVGTVGVKIKHEAGHAGKQVGHAECQLVVAPADCFGLWAPALIRKASLCLYPMKRSSRLGSATMFTCT